MRTLCRVLRGGLPLSVCKMGPCILVQVATRVSLQNSPFWNSNLGQLPHDVGSSACCVLYSCYRLCAAMLAMGSTVSAAERLSCEPLSVLLANRRDMDPSQGL